MKIRETGNIAAFLTLAVGKGKWPASLPYHFILWETAPVIYRVEDWLGLRSGLEIMEQNLLPLPGMQPRLLGRPARSVVATSTELSRLRVSLLKKKDQYALQNIPAPDVVHFWTCPPKLVECLAIFCSPNGQVECVDRSRHGTWLLKWITVCSHVGVKLER
jgi:hypothetical protein